MLSCLGFYETGAIGLYWYYSDYVCDDGSDDDGGGIINGAVNGGGGGSIDGRLEFDIDTDGRFNVDNGGGGGKSKLDNDGGGGRLGNDAGLSLLPFKTIFNGGGGGNDPKLSSEGGGGNVCDYWALFTSN